MSFQYSTFRSISGLLLLASTAAAQGAPPAAASPPAAQPTAASPPAAPATPPPAAPATPPPAAPAATPPAATPSAPEATQPASTDPATAESAAPAATAVEANASAASSDAGAASSAPSTEEQPVASEPRVLPPPTSPPPPPPPPEPVVLGDAGGRLQLGLGLGLNWIGDDEFDLFSNSDVLLVASLRAGLTFWQSGRWSALGVLSGNYAGVGAVSRGTPTHLDVGRLLAGVEVRGHVLSGLVGYGRVLGGAALVGSRVGPGGQPTTLGLFEAGGAINGALGTAVRLYGSKNGPARAFRLEAYLEGGFDFTTEVGLVYEAGPDGPPRPEPLDLGGLSLSGALLGFGLQGSY